MTNKQMENLNEKWRIRNSRKHKHINKKTLLLIIINIFFLN